MKPIVKELIECLRTHDPESRVLGNVQAGPAADALESLNALVVAQVALLRRARVVIPQEYEDEIEVRHAINFHLNLNAPIHGEPYL